MSSVRWRSGRHLDGDDGEPVEEVLAETALGDQLREVLVRGGEDAHVHAERLLAADALEGLLLQRAQHLGLGLDAHVADLVQEQRAAVGQLELSAPPADRAGERAALVTEQLGLDQLLGDGGAVDLDERAVPSRGLGVDGARHQLLAGPFSPWISTRPLVGAAMRDLLAQLLDDPALADDPLTALELLAQVTVLALEAAVVERSGRGQQDLLERERLLDEVVRAELGGLDGGLDGAVTGDHDHGGLGTDPLELREGLEPVCAGHPDVEEDQVRRLVLQLERGLPAPTPPRRRGSPRPPARRAGPSGSRARRRR